MKKIKLVLTVEQQSLLNDMLRYVVLVDDMRRRFPTEYYVIMEWYDKSASRFLFATKKPFFLTPSGACALHKIMRERVWIFAFQAVASVILWQLDKYFASAPATVPAPRALPGPEKELAVGDETDFVTKNMDTYFDCEKF